MKNILILCSVFFTNTLLYADDDSKKDELVAKILKPDDSQKITSFEMLGPIGLQLKEITAKFGQNQQNFQIILLDELNEEALKFSGTDSPEIIDAYKNYFTEEELQYILDLRKNKTWMKTNNSQYVIYFLNKAMKEMVGSAMSRFINGFIQQIINKALNEGLDENTSNKLLSFIQKELNTPKDLGAIKAMEDQYDKQIQQSNLPKAADGVTKEKLILAGEYTSRLYNPNQMVQSVMMMIKILLNKLEEQADKEKEKISNIANEFMNKDGKELLKQFYQDTFFKAHETAMAEIFTLQELKEIIELKNQPIVQKLNTFSQEILTKMTTKIVMQKTMESIKNNESFIRIAVNKALEKAKGLNLISEEALGNIQKEVLAMKM
jgi:hypothetical protein